MESPNSTNYAPLCQVMTDSESEEEIHNISKYRKQQNKIQLNNKLETQNQKQINLENSDPLDSFTSNQDALIKLMHQVDTSHQQRQKFQSIHYTTGRGQQPTSYTTNMQNTFRSVMMSDIGLNNGERVPCDPSSNFSSFNSDFDDRNHIDATDEVAILGRNSESKKTQMYPMRRCCFIASLILCVLGVISFIWLVPCSEESSCPSLIDRIKTRNWLNNYTKIEFKGGVNIISRMKSWENNLIFLYRGDVFFPEGTSTKRNGIISLIGSSGAVAWYDETVDEPVAIDCTLLDVDRNGRPDCLVVDEYGELSAINPISGQWLWKYKERSAVKLDYSDFPVIMPDLNGDRVLDILIVTSPDLEQRTKNFVHKGELKTTGYNSYVPERNILRILSGATGKPIGDVLRIHDCDVVRKLQMEGLTVTYNCLRNNTEAQRSKPLPELFALITNKSIVGQTLLSAGKIAQHHHSDPHKDIDAQRNIYSLNGRELVVENRGTCPMDCSVTLILSENKNGKVNVISNFTNNGMYGMVPVQWHFKNTKTKMSGFVMKFWKWNNIRNNDKDMRKMEATKFNTYNMNDDILQKTFNNKNGKSTLNKDNGYKSKFSTKPNYTQLNKTKKNYQKRDITQSKPLLKHEFDNFEHLIHKRQTYNIPTEGQFGHNLTSIFPSKQKTTVDSIPLMNHYQMQMITETVMLVLFIGGDTRIENTSQTNIIQFCHNDRGQMICQPDLNNQEHSMLIADLDQDNSQELVSYMSTYVESSDKPNNWKLVTNVRLLRIQSELPAFYDNKSDRN